RVTSKPLSCMTLVASLMMSVLPYWWRTPVRQPLRAAAQRTCLTIIPRASSNMPMVSGPRMKSRTMASSTAAIACLPPRPARPEPWLVAADDLRSMVGFPGRAKARCGSPNGSARLLPAHRELARDGSGQPEAGGQPGAAARRDADDDRDFGVGGHVLGIDA